MWLRILHEIELTKLKDITNFRSDNKSHISELNKTIDRWDKVIEHIISKMNRCNDELLNMINKPLKNDEDRIRGVADDKRNELRDLLKKCSKSIGKYEIELMKARKHLKEIRGDGNVIQQLTIKLDNFFKTKDGAERNRDIRRVKNDIARYKAAIKQLEQDISNYNYAVNNTITQMEENIIKKLHENRDIRITKIVNMFSSSQKLLKRCYKKLEKYITVLNNIGENVNNKINSYKLDESAAFARANDRLNALKSNKKPRELSPDFNEKVRKGKLD